MKYKTKDIEQLFLKINPVLIRVAQEMDDWSVKYDKNEIVITEAFTTLEHDKKVGRLSATHREGRAIDIRCNDWPNEKLADFLVYFDAKYRRYGAVAKDGSRRFVLAHGEGVNLHIHVQIGRDIKYKRG